MQALGRLTHDGGVGTHDGASAAHESSRVRGRMLKLTVTPAGRSGREGSAPGGVV
jgi:hypothetical protein